jgi:hypothetical protein
MMDHVVFFPSNLVPCFYYQYKDFKNNLSPVESGPPGYIGYLKNYLSSL